LERNLQIGFKDKKRNFGELGATWEKFLTYYISSVVLKHKPKCNY
jgi:hypothetical protein